MTRDDTYDSWGSNHLVDSRSHLESTETPADKVLLQYTFRALGYITRSRIFRSYCLGADRGVVFVTLEANVTTFFRNTFRFHNFFAM